jgi:hypothetical protein
MALSACTAKLALQVTTPAAKLAEGVQPTEPSASTKAPALTVRAAHRIRVRVVDGVGEFYDDQTGERFVPRGNNYIRLAPTGSILYHSTFNVGLYDTLRAGAALESMRMHGYNVVRVFLAPNEIGDPAGGLSQPYVANLADFVQLAKANEMFVILTTDDFAARGGYVTLQDTTWSADFPGSHATFLLPGGIQAERRFWSDLVKALIQQNTPLDAILAYELRNEHFFLSDAPPLTLTSGTVTTANGTVYDLRSEQEKQRMLEEGIVYWIDSTRAAILEVDPTALVTVGFFVPHGPNTARVGDPRIVVSAPAIQESRADFFDLHAYPDAGLSLRANAENFGILGMQEKPIILGEFGGHARAYSSYSDAASAFEAWQVESCAYGFDGWLTWTWDTDEDRDFFYATDGKGQINEALAPANRPDPCSAR